MNGISQQMQLEFAAGVADLDDEPAVILVCVRVGHGLLPAHPLLGKEHEQLYRRPSYMDERRDALDAWGASSTARRVKKKPPKT